MFDDVDCDREDCRFQNLGSSTTLIGWSPVYDKQGNQVNHDPNTRRTGYRCTSCARRFEVKTQSGKTTVTEL